MKIPVKSDRLAKTGLDRAVPCSRPILEPRPGHNEKRGPISKKGRDMFGLLRLAFWGTLILLVIPLDGDGTIGPVDLTSPVKAVSAAREMAADLSRICERNPEACERGRDLAATVSERARVAALAAYEALGQSTATPDPSIHTGTVAQ